MFAHWGARRTGRHRPSCKNKSELRRAISKNLSLKFTPDLRFRLDETFDRMDETRRLFSQDDVLRDLDET